MKKSETLSQALKQWLWNFFDNVFYSIIISILWFIFSIPTFFTLYMFVYSKYNYPVIYILLINLLFYSPISFGASYSLLQITSRKISSNLFTLFSLQEQEKVHTVKIKIFFQGIFKFFFKSCLLVVFNSIIFSFIFYNISFYLKIVAPKFQIIGLILTGLMLWIAILFFLMQTYFIPLLLTRKISFIKIAYQAFLLTTDNLLYSFAVTVITTSLSVIMGFSIAGIFLIFYGLIGNLQILACLHIYRQYDPTMEIIEEKRTLKNIIRPWD